MRLEDSKLISPYGSPLPLYPSQNSSGSWEMSEQTTELLDIALQFGIPPRSQRLALKYSRSSLSPSAICADLRTFPDTTILPIMFIMSRQSTGCSLLLEFLFKIELISCIPHIKSLLPAAVPPKPFILDPAY